MEIQKRLIINYDLSRLLYIILCNNNAVILNYAVDVVRIGSTRSGEGALTGHRYYTMFEITIM